MVKTKCIKNDPEASDGKRILVMRIWPRGKSKDSVQIDKWVKDVAPSRELLADWRAGRISWSQYVARYKKEMSRQSTAIESLAAMAAKEIITLLCNEAEGDPHCHRYLLREMIESRMQQSGG
jgi:uncharacterized protein YeaO (DUF488 family)